MPRCLRIAPFRCQALIIRLVVYGVIFAELANSSFVTHISTPIGITHDNVMRVIDVNCGVEKRDLGGVTADVQKYTDGQLKWILDYGIWPSGMPGSKGTLSDDELWSIVVYMRHLPPAGSQGTPEMYTH